MTGCASNPVTGKSQLMLVSEKEEIQMDKLYSPQQLSSDFGATQDIARVYVYDNVEELQYFEPFHIQVRNLPKDKREEIYKIKKKKENYKHLFDYK